MTGEIIRKIVDIIFIILDIIIIGYVLYFFITGLFAFKKEKKKNKSKEKLKFAVLIPARNEENIIDNLILSLQAQKYPKENYDIFVILNNCTDKTEEIVKELGVNVINCIPGIKNKGEALKYGFSYMIKNYPEYEAYAIFDADNVVHPRFLQEMNNAMCLGYDVVQGYRDSKNPSDSWISCSYTLFYLVQNYFFNRARVRMNYSASINGTGFAVTKKIIEEHGFKTVTITEDIEYAALCSLNDVPIYFAEKAITYDEQPINFGTSWKQRKRWSIGTMSCMKNYSSKLTKKAVKEKRAQSFDMALFYMAPIIQILSFFVIVFYMFWNIFEPGIFIGKVVTIITSYVTCVVFSVATLLLTKRKIKKYIKGIFTLPFFILTWIPINIVCLFVKEIKWEQIKHQRKVEVESIVKFD
mgnify:FL=1